MPAITVYENENCFLDFTLKYGRNWHSTAVRNTPVPQASVGEVYFYVTQTASGSAIITRTVSNGGISWVSATLGQIRVNLSTQTATFSGDNLFYELRLKFTDGSYVTAETGGFNIKQSLVDRP